MVFVESTAIEIHLGIADPGLGDQHHHGMRQRPATHHQELDCVIQASRVALLLIDDWKEFLNVRAEELGLETALPGPHPVDIALKSIDLAVMADISVGMGQWPGGKGVRTEPRMDQG